MDTVSLVAVPETGGALHRDPTKEESPPDENMNGSSRKKPKRRQKKKKKTEEALCEEEKTLDASEKTTEEDQLHPPKNLSSNIRIQGDSCQQDQDSCEKPEDSQSGAIDMSSSEKKKKKRKKKKDKDINVLGESGVDTNSEVTTKRDARHSSEAQGSKLKSKEGKSVDSTVVNGCLESKDDTVVQQEGADAKADETVSETQNPKAKKKKRRKTKTTEVCEALENSQATSMESEPVEFMETSAGVSEVKTKKRKRKNKKTSPIDEETADMEVCDPSSDNSLLATVESGSVLDHPNKEVLEHCDKNAGTLEEKTNDENGEPKQKKRRKKKKKSCEDHKTDNADAEKDDVSVPRSEGELEFDGEKLDTHLSSSVLINDDMAQGVTTQETGDLPRCSCNGQSTRNLIVFDLNGILADIARGNTGDCVPDGKISFRSVFKRPFVDTFLDFCFEKFDVGIWSSRRIGLNYMTDIVMGNHAKNLLFSFDQRICITTNFKTLENTTKPIFLKDLRTVWNRFGTCLSCGKRKYDETNTLLVDDSPDKALCNPPHTGIFPFPYQYTDREDSALGPDGELRKYMERLVDAENVQKFVEENPIGQSAITETHESWTFYSRVIKAHKT
ncbi:FCP1 homology domain-containing protein [Hirschfeldia incana]|nr:FCP1 homology domain-containing protein [Hirschfeldia incana]KAJ0247836.1 FCP1 homology domain-containing protein [Hirschfeldia incana]